MSFYATFILIISVVYILYVTFQLHSDYKKSRPLEGQNEEHFTINPENKANVNSKKVTMNDDSISLVPEEQIVHPTLDRIDKLQKDPPSSPQSLLGANSSNPSSNNSSIKPLNSQSSAKQDVVDPYTTSVVKEEIVIPKTRQKLMIAHTQEHLSMEFIATTLFDAIKKGIIKTVETEESDNERTDNNNMQNVISSAQEEKISSSYIDVDGNNGGNPSFSEDFDNDFFGSYDHYPDNDIHPCDAIDSLEEELTKTLASDLQNVNPGDCTSETIVKSKEQQIESSLALNPSSQANIDVPTDNLPSYLNSSIQTVASKINEMEPIKESELDLYDFSSLNSNFSGSKEESTEINSETGTNHTSLKNEIQMGNNVSPEVEDYSHENEEDNHSIRNNRGFLSWVSSPSLSFI